MLIEQIAIDAGTQVRAELDEATVADYAACMAKGAIFPPVVLFYDGNRHVLADGFQRVLAARRNDRQDIAIEVHVGTTADALWFALGANKTNGRRLNDADKKHAALLAFQSWPDKSSGLIAEQIGCNQGYVNV